MHKPPRHSISSYVFCPCMHACMQAVAAARRSLRLLCTALHRAQRKPSGQAIMEIISHHFVIGKRRRKRKRTAIAAAALRLLLLLLLGSVLALSSSSHRNTKRLHRRKLILYQQFNECIPSTLFTGVRRFSL